MPEGEQGFEGFIKALFESETGHSFYLARKGDQPGGDAVSVTKGIALEAKRYLASTSISEDKIEGEIDRALRESKSLDIFVVVATKSLAQLAARLKAKTRETGLDILCLELEESLTELGVLCLKHPQVVRTFLPRLDSVWFEWADKELSSPEAEAALNRLRQSLLGLATREYLSEVAGAQLRQRFSGEGSGARVHNRVFLQSAVARPSIENALTAWWEKRDSGVAVLEGDEGTGKTWVAASFVKRLFEHESALVLWVDSISWAQAASIEQVIDIALNSLFVADESLCRRLRHKIFHLWANPILLVLDGANERNAWNAADLLLREYETHRAALRSHIRILFTSRKLDQRATRRQFWIGSETISVGPFDPEEFKAALSRADSNLTPEELTAAVREFAAIPRYFQLCIHLRERLSSLHHLNKQILLWADLQDKLASGDPQFAALQGELHHSPEEILAHFAHKIGWPKEACVAVNTEELQRTLPNFQKVRTDLMEQRIILQAGSDTTILSSDHVILGWALVLLELAKWHANEDTGELSDRLLRELEPAAANDDKVRAIHVATLLAFLEDGGANVNLTAVRAALLSLWVTDHNAIVGSESLRFFASADLSAYVRAVEVLFRDYLGGELETTVIAPLAQGWRDQSLDMGALDVALNRWLKLIFPGDVSGSEKGDTVPFLGLFKAETPEQLRLSYAALSIISFRPVIDLLPALIDCLGSHSFCYVDREGGGFKHRHSIKSLGEPLGVLLRWGYTDAIIPELQGLSKNYPKGSPRETDFQYFVQLLRIAELPPELGTVDDIYTSNQPSPTQEVENLGRRLKATGDTKDGILGFNFGALAVRRDLPELGPDEISALCKEVEKRVSTDAAIARNESTIENKQLHNLLPWLARYAPRDFGAVCGKLWRHVICRQDSVPGVFDLDESLPATDPNGELVQTVIQHTESLLVQPRSDLLVGPITEILLLHATLDQLVQWLERIEQQPFKRGHSGISYLPLPKALRGLAPKGLAEIAERKFLELHASLKNSPTDSNLKQKALHWLNVYAYTAGPDAGVGARALKLADELESDERFSFALFLLACECEDVRIYERALSHPAFRQNHLGFNSWRWTRKINDPTFLTLENLKTKTSLTVAGWLLHYNGRDEEVRKWGGFVMKMASVAARADSESDAAWAEIEVTVCEGRQFGGIGPKSPNMGGSSWHDISSPVWGIDRESHRPSATQNDLDEMLERFRIDADKLRKSLRNEFSYFNATTPLLRYSELEPEAFKDYAVKFLTTTVERSKDLLDMSFFTKSVWIGLLRTSPEEALRFSEHQRNSVQYQVFTFDGAISWETRELWSKELNDHPQVSDFRRQLLTDAVNDEVLFWHVAAAQADDNSNEITRLANIFLAAPTARDRAIGVILLAFHGDPESLGKLNQCAATDNSFWIRKDSLWASEVCALEIACKQRYREVLQGCTLESLACGLAELRMAFSPMARVWRHKIEREIESLSLDRKIRTYLDLHWYHWEHTSAHTENIKLCGVKLREHCRGEPLKDGVTNRQAPWWKLDP